MTDSVKVTYIHIYIFIKTYVYISFHKIQMAPAKNWKENLNEIIQYFLSHE